MFRLTTALAGMALVLFLGWWGFGGQFIRMQDGRDEGPPPRAELGFEEVARFRALEATQGVAVSEAHFFAIGNTVIGKYDRETGRRVGEWSGASGGSIVHLNSCLLVDRQLVCAHSNYPRLPMLSTIEIWDPETMEHVESKSLEFSDGSLTWAIHRDGDWWLNFAHYGLLFGGTPGKGPESSAVVQFDEDWRRKASFAYPPALIGRFRPYSSSGGNWAPDGSLYVTGHDEPEIYVLRVPEMGAVLEWTETIPAPMQGQGWAFDPTDPQTVWGIVREIGEVVAGTLQP